MFGSDQQQYGAGQRRGSAWSEPVRGRMVSPAQIGRTTEVSRTTQGIVPPAVVVIEGEAGVGKTRLVTEVLAGDGLAERYVLLGHCSRIRDPFPLGPVIEALRGMPERGSIKAFSQLSPITGVLRPWIPELADRLPEAPEPVVDRGAERHQIFRGLVELLRALGPVVLVVEDMHWADEQTIEFIRYLVSGAQQEVAVVLTYRGEDVDPAVRDLTARVPQALQKTEVTLVPLSQAETGVLAATILGVETVEDDFAAALYRLTAGLPFAIEEVLATLQVEGSDPPSERWTQRALDGQHVPSGVRDFVLERVSRLSEEARSVVETAAILNVLTPVSTIEQVLRLQPGAATAATAEALNSAVLIEHGEDIGLRHVLASQAIVEDMPRLSRRRLHRQAAAALEVLAAVPLGQVAYHQFQAGDLDEWAAAAERASDHAAELGNDAEVIRLLSEVLRLAPLLPEHRGRLAVKLSRAAVESLKTDEIRGLLSDALRVNLAAEVRGEIRVHLGGLIQESGGNLTEARALFAGAVPDLDGRPDLQAWAMVALGIPNVTAVDITENSAWLERAIEVIPTVDDAAFRVFLLGKVAMILTPTGDSRWREFHGEIVTQTDDEPRHRREVNAYLSLGLETSYAGHHKTARRLLSSARTGAAVSEGTRLETRLGAAFVLLDYCTGQWDNLRERANGLADELSSSPPALAEVQTALGGLALARGQLDEAHETLTAAVDLLTEVGGVDLLPIPVAALLRLAVNRNQVADALELAESTVALLESKDVWASTVRMLVPLIQALATDGVESQELVSRFESQVAGRDVPLAPAALMAARAFTTNPEVRPTHAARLFLDSAEKFEALQCPYEAAQAREQAAAALFTANDERAEAVMRTAFGTYERLDARWDAARTAQLARAHGIRVAGHRKGGREAYGAKLSPREAEVAELAATGRSNKEIARELFLSINTVSRHLTNAMRKLGVRSRSAIIHRLTEEEHRDRPDS